MATATKTAARHATGNGNNHDSLIDTSPITKSEVRVPGVLQITPPRMRTARFHIIGTAPLVMNNFSQKAQIIIEETQIEGGRSRSRKERKPKDFDALYEGAKHYSHEGWIGIPCAAFRCGGVSTCRLVDFKMTLAKMALFVEADGYDRENGQPLVRIIKGEPTPIRMMVRNATGVVDVRVRPIWHEWEAIVRVRFDNDRFSLQDIVNLMDRLGQQVGILEGRPDSPNSAGMGWGLYRLGSVEHDGDTR